MMGDMGTMGGLGMGFGWIFAILFWGLIIVAVVALVKWLIGATTNENPGSDKSPLTMLEERYARGEIDQGEFEKMKKDLA